MNISFMLHQKKAIERLKQSNGRQLLNLPIGAGKTLTTLYFLQDKKISDVLIVAPVSILGVWNEEAEKWFNRPVNILRGNKKEREFLYSTHLHGWCAVGYETLLRDWKKILSFPFQAIVLDESHKIKSPTAKISRLLRKMTHKTPIRIALSGTPMKNGWQDIWSQISFIEPTALYGNFYTFRNIHAIMPIPGVPAITGWRDVETIKNKIKPWMFSIPVEEVQKNLPPCVIQDIQLSLSSVEQARYDRIRDELLLEIEGEDISIPNALVKLIYLRETVDGVFDFEHSSKLVALKELLDTIGDEKVIVFSEFATVIHNLSTVYPQAEVITGATKDRDGALARWKKNGRILLGTSAMSSGLNLQEAHYVIQLDLPWTKAEEDQRIGRVWRTGQRNKVVVYNLMAEKTVDYGIRKLIEKKKSMMEELGQATMADIKDILL